jgi:hypothetical protein
MGARTGCLSKYQRLFSVLVSLPAKGSALTIMKSANRLCGLSEKN